MTEDQAERLAEYEMDRLDKRFLRGAISQGEYDAGVNAIDLRVRKRISGARRLRNLRFWWLDR